ncbi:MAG: hypothetical protein AB7N76_19865 [Planctomycetota bacterium]
MARVNRYRVVVYGASNKAPDLKAKIELYHQTPDALVTVGKIRFHTGEVPHDEAGKGEAIMNLPADLLSSTLQVLRNEAQLYFNFHEGRAVLGTGVERVGSHDETTPRLVRVVDDERAYVAPPPPAAALEVVGGEGE